MLNAMTERKIFNRVMRRIAEAYMNVASSFCANYAFYIFTDMKIGCALESGNYTVVLTFVSESCPHFITH